MDKTGGPAFPRTEFLQRAEGQRTVTHASGMTLRQWYAGQALAGLLASGPHDCDARGIAHDALMHADAMIEYERQEEDRTIHRPEGQTE